MKCGFAREIITPKIGVPLCGYFDPRPNDGAFDDLYIRALAMEAADGSMCAILSADVCFIAGDLIERCKAEMAKCGIGWTDQVLFSATHSHTAPYPDRFFGYDPDEEWLQCFAERSAVAVKRAAENVQECEFCTGEAFCDTLAFNRRYWMKDGSVLTNPGKLNPEIVKPEGAVDYSIPMLAWKSGGKLTALLVNIVNHTDTIAGNTVSADWPGRMEREIQNKLGYDVPVIMLLGASGNINHFDNSTDRDQSSFAEATRIGKEYAAKILSALDGLKKIEADGVRVVSDKITIPYAVITEEEAARAKEVLAKPAAPDEDAEMTASGLARGEGPVARFFAGQLLSFRETCVGEREFYLLSIQFGDQAAIVTLPGEPFTEIGLAVKAASCFETTLVSSLSMGECGYIPLPECFARGGYEILPVEGGGPAHDTAPRLIEAASALVK